MAVRRRVPFVLVDVFTDRPLDGNPLALLPDADDIPEALLPRIAREFNQAETTFLLRPTLPGADHRLRSFTPEGTEVFGAGHNALGAWWWLAACTDRLHGRGGRTGAAGRRHQQLGDEVLPVTLGTDADDRSEVTMRQQAPRFGAEPARPAELAGALGVDPSQLGAGSGLPVAQVVFTGAAHLMVGLRDRAAVDAARPDAALLRAVLPGLGGEGVYLYALDPREADADAHARFFNPVAGITEDPATGTAAGPLACLLRRHGLLRTDRAVVAQGHALGRPSRLRLDFDGDTPQLTGRAALAASGELTLPE
ncbi:PhzF family phenazine biosynthesis protein [Streptomyces sp. RKND-216]|uniref:PhzF family phenazine biosynthesis protein n=1 Tax=Streptomyces sp. RKND-216 TaxID=2562581 RepID=UPI00109E1B14|nr:PhzF family phenazine biosynthesis protein [Streptomyces sp. RKND-216]THA25065.1 PhzF family phenazine biosynthesis protein [Streptomyces sp. RKND-216]